jgi:hypothetical protein
MDDLNSPSGLPGLTQAEAATIFDDPTALAEFAGNRGKPKFDEESLITAHGELTAEHIELARAHISSGASLGVQPTAIKALRHSHHRLAMLLASGIDETKAAIICNYSVSRISILKADPAFQELLSYYSDQVEETWAGFHETASGLSLDMLQELQRRLDESPEQFTVASLNESIKLLADRTGHAPVTKSVSVNVNADVGTRLAEARRKAQQLAAEVLNAGE